MPAKMTLARVQEIVDFWTRQRPRAWGAAWSEILCFQDGNQNAYRVAFGRGSDSAELALLRAISWRLGFDGW